MKSLEMIAFGVVYRNRTILLTGHTGFKGSWLTFWLKTLGAHTTGLSLGSSSTPSCRDLLGLDMDDKRINIRDAAAVRDAFHAAAPEVVFHLAAQLLARRSYYESLETWSTNVKGTSNILEACWLQPDVRTIVVITSNKCYENREWDLLFTDHPQLHEAKLLCLDSPKARQRLDWRPVWSLDESLSSTANWCRPQVEHESVISQNQLQNYVIATKQAGLER